MRNRDRLALAAGLVLVGLFLLALVASVQRRAGSMFDYPDYSSLNNSDNGLKAYHDALEHLGFHASRNFQPLHKLAGIKADILYAGPSIQSFQYADKADLELFERIAEGGSRVILLLSHDGLSERQTAETKSSLPVTKKSKVQPPEPTLKQLWGIEAAPASHSFPKSEPDKVLSELGLTRASWIFTRWTNSWSPDVFREASPLVLERHFGRGSVVLVGDAKLFTNRELLAHADSRILTTILGQSRDIVFDESHLGIADTGTVTALAKAHHLQWLVLGFIVLAALYVWRSAASFVPRPGSPTGNALPGQDSYVALSNLLRQSVPRKSILFVAAEEWNRSRAMRARNTKQIVADDLAALRSLQSDAAPAAYNELIRKTSSGSLH